MTRFTMTFPAKALLPLPAALLFTLAACGEREDPTYEAGAEDLSGGEFIVTEPDPDAIPVDLPRTEMTPVVEDTETPTAAPAE